MPSQIKRSALLALFFVLPTRAAMAWDLPSWNSTAVKLLKCEDSLSHSDLLEALDFVAKARNPLSLERALVQIDDQLGELDRMEVEFYANPYKHLPAREEARNDGVAQFGPQWFSTAKKLSQEGVVATSDLPLIKAYGIFLARDFVRTQYEKVRSKHQLVKNRLMIKRHFVSVAFSIDVIEDWHRVAGLLQTYKTAIDGKEAEQQMLEQETNELKTELYRILKDFPQFEVEIRSICGNFLERRP